MRKLALAAALLATACGDPLLFAELEIPSVEVKLPSQSFPATTIPPGAPCSTPCVISQPFTYDLGSQVSVLDEKNVTSEIRVTALSIALTANGPLANFANVRSVRLWMVAPPGSALQDVVVAAYDRPPGAAPQQITVSGYSNVDLAPYLQAGLLQVAAEMAFDTGIPSFTADVTGDFYLKVKLDYGKLAGL